MYLLINLFLFFINSICPSLRENKNLGSFIPEYSSYSHYFNAYLTYIKKKYKYNGIHLKHNIDIHSKSHNHDDSLNNNSLSSDTSNTSFLREKEGKHKNIYDIKIDIENIQNLYEKIIEILSKKKGGIIDIEITIDYIGTETHLNYIVIHKSGIIEYYEPQGNNLQLENTESNNYSTLYIKQ